jgi:hypothetical protein
MSLYVRTVKTGMCPPYLFAALAVSPWIEDRGGLIDCEVRPAAH